MNNKDKIEIGKTFYSIYFPDFIGDGVFEIVESTAKEIWQQNIDKKARHFFEITDENWVLKNKNFLLGNWFENFNTESNDDVYQILEKQIDWKTDDIIWFFISNNSILETSWFLFKKYWRNFLTCYDDSPIILNKYDSEIALGFISNGELLKINRDK